jgi:hypothetical protein
MKCFLRWCWFLGLCGAVAHLPAQTPQNFGDRLIVGTSFTYIPLWEDGPEFTLDEYTWSKNIAVNLNRHFYLGIDFRNIWTRGSMYQASDAQNQYYMVGAFSQFDFLPNERLRLFAEGSLYYGNYYQPLIREDPYRKDGLVYVGMGAGLDLPLWKFLSLDLAFHFNKIPAEWRVSDNFTQYIIGLNFNFGQL